MSTGPGAWVYKTQRWLRLRLAHLQIEPLCRYCAQMGRIVPATEVDHVVPHRGDRDLAFDADNLQSLCETCHNRHKQAVDRGQPLAGCDADGYPIDPAHKWGAS